MADKAKILDIDISSIISKSSELKSELDSLKKKQAELKKEGDTSSSAYVKLEASIKKLSYEYSMNQKQLSNLAKVGGDFLTVNEKINFSLAKEINTQKEAEANVKELILLRKELNLNDKEQLKIAEQLNKKIDENNDFIKENSSQLEKQKIAIGDYKNQIKEAVNELNIFNGGLVGFIERSQQAGGVGNLLSNSLKGITTGIVGATRASLAFIATPIGAVIGAIGLVLGGVITYLKSTQSGIDKITAVTRPLQAVMESLFGVLQDVGKALFDAFSNPKQLLTDLAEFVKTNLINRFKAFGVILDGIINLDFKKITNGVLQAGTGVENMTDKIANASKETGKFFDEAIKKGQELDRLEKELEKTRINNKIQIGEINQAIKEQNRIAEDQTKPLAEREAAAQKSIELAQNLNVLKQKELDLEIAILKNKQSRNDTSRAEEEQLAELIAKKNEANAQELELVTTQQNKLNSIRKEAQAKALAEAQKATDAAIARSKAQIDLFIAEQGYRAKSLEEQFLIEQTVTAKRLALLEQEFKAGKKIKEEYEAEKLNIQNEFLQKQAELTVDFARRELQAEVEKSKSFMQNNKFLSQQILEEETNRLNQLAQKRRDYEGLRLQEGIISQTEYNDAINIINAENQTKIDEANLARKEAEKEQEKIDLENKMAIEDLQFQNDLAILIERLNKRKAEELLNAEKTGASKKLINDKYAALEKKLIQEVEHQKLQATANSLSQAATLFKENTLANKALSIAQASINTYVGATRALADYPMPYSAVMAGVTIATGLASVAKIAGIKFEKGGLLKRVFGKGGMISKVFSFGGILKGPSHANGGIPTPFGEMEGKEAIINKRSTEMFKPLLSAINVAGGGVAFAKGGIPDSPAVSSLMSSMGQKNPEIIDYDLLADKIGQKVGQKVGEANAQLPPNKLVIEEFNTANNNYLKIIKGADFG